MASSGKKKTTMSKLNRERKLQERRLDKAARKDARKQAALEPPEESGEFLRDESGEFLRDESGQLVRDESGEDVGDEQEAEVGTPTGQSSR